MRLSPDCYLMNDHRWNGTSQCECGARLRCICGCFVREDNLAAHVAKCRTIAAEARENQELIDRENPEKLRDAACRRGSRRDRPWMTDT